MMPARDPVARKAYQAAHYRANLDRERAKRRAYNETHREEAKARSVVWRLKHPGYHRAAHLRIKYGITPGEFDHRVAAQAGRCLICAVEFTQGGKTTAPAVDHGHGSQKVRGILCHRCNVGIGMLGDDPQTLRAAADYLEGECTGPRSTGISRSRGKT